MYVFVLCVIGATALLYYKLHAIQKEIRMSRNELINELVISRRTAQGLCSCALVNDENKNHEEWTFLCPVCAEKDEE